MALEADYHKQKDYKPVQALGFSLVTIIKLFSFVLGASPLRKHHTSVLHLGVGKAYLETAIDFRGGCQPALVKSR